MKIGCGNPKLSALFISDPSSAVARVHRALSSCKGDVTAAADALGVSVPTLYRWIRLHPEIRGEKNPVRKAGRPRKEAP